MTAALKVIKVSFSPVFSFNDTALRMGRDPFTGLRPVCLSILNNVPAVSLQTPPDHNHSCPPGYSAGPKVGSTATGDPLPGLMGNEFSSDPFRP